MEVLLKTDRYFTCPTGCPDKFFVEHLLAEMEQDIHGCGRHEQRTAGPWYCDTCGQGWLLVLFKTGKVQVEKENSRLGDGKKRACWVILEIPPQDQPIRLKVRGAYFQAKLTQEELDHKRYYYEEHTCPTNYFRDVETISVGTDDDPHGLAKLVTVYDVEAAPEIERAFK